MVATMTNSWGHQQLRNSSSNGRPVIQQRSPQTQKNLLSPSSSTSTSSSSPSPNKVSVRQHHGPTRATIISVRVVVYRLLAVFTVLFLCGIVTLTLLWNPRQGHNNDGQHYQPQQPDLRILSSRGAAAMIRRNHQHQHQRSIKTPFDGLEASKNRQKILAWLNKTQEVDSISSPTPNSSTATDAVAAAVADAIMDIDPNLTTWERSLVHIVNTRFMQEQGHLKALGRARLHLFRTFCLPTMVHQSTQQFLWIIKTDPKLDMGILQDLINDLKPYPNIYLVASNVNYMIRENHKQATNRHSWRDGAEIEDILHSTIYTGDPTTLYQAMLQKDKQVVLETRLDADDGLHKLYLQQIQEKALDQFDIIEPSPSDEEEEQGDSGTTMKTTEPYIPPRWLYWCTRRHVEWHGGVQMTPTFTKTINDTMVSSSVPDYYGNLLVVEHSRLCITPGITVGFGIGTPSQEVPIHAHDKLFQAIHSLKPENACGYTKVSDCLELVEDMLLVAVRARTPTSAGMQRVMGTDLLDESSSSHGNNNNNTTTNTNNKMKGTLHQPPQPSPLKMYLYWDILHDDFALLREQIQYTNRYILNHLVPIAEDNLEGQCTSDHSCKNETREKLLKIIQGNQ